MTALNGTVSPSALRWTPIGHWSRAAIASLGLVGWPEPNASSDIVARLLVARGSG
jgi:hypothetical protein